MIIVVAMFSDIHEDGRSYESSNHSDSNDESTVDHENHFIPHPPPSSSSSSFTNIDNIHMSNTSDHTASESSDVAERVCKVLDFMSTVNFDLTVFLDALSWGYSSCFNDPKNQYVRMSADYSPSLVETTWNSWIT